MKKYGMYIFTVVKDKAPDDKGRQRKTRSACRPAAIHRH